MGPRSRPIVRRAPVLALVASLVLGACSGDMGGQGDPQKGSRQVGPPYKFATSALSLQSATDSYAIDIDGDGVEDNQLRRIIRAVLPFIDIQAQLDAAIAEGRNVLLVDVGVMNLIRDAGEVGVSVAAPPAPSEAPPRFDGSDTFKMQPDQMPARLRGTIEAGALATVLPKDQVGTEVQTVLLTLPFGSGAVLPIRAYGVHLQGKVSDDGISDGRFHGVIRQGDLDAEVIPALARALTLIVNFAPQSATAMAVIQLFETLGGQASEMKCRASAADCCGKSPATCKILSDEVRTNPIIGGLLKPDVRCFDGDTFRPQPGSPTKDSLSLGIAMRAVRASF